MPTLVDHYRRVELATLGFTDPVLADPDDPIAAVVAAMAAAHTSCACVVRDGSVVGIFTERDVATKVARYPDLWQMPVSHVMTADPHRLDGSQSAYDALSLMNAGRFRNAPVVVDGSLIGTFTHYDLIEMAADYLARNESDDQEASPVHSLRFVNFLGLDLAYPITAPGDASVADAIDLMIANDTGLVTVVGDRGTIVGEFTEHDLFTKVACRVEALEDEVLESWMTTDVASTDIRASIADGIALMSDKGHRYLVLVNEIGRPLQTATFRDIASYLESVLAVA